MIPVFVGTSSGRDEWLRQFQRSMYQRPFTVVGDEASWELGKIKWIYENTQCERFLFLHDSIEVKDHQFFQLIDRSVGSVAICSDPVPFGMFLGVYERSVLARVRLWQPHSQYESVKAELLWTSLYTHTAEKVSVLFPEFADRNATRIVHKFGRNNLLLENKYLRKFKGTWGVNVHALRDR